MSATAPDGLPSDFYERAALTALTTSDSTMVMRDIVLLVFQSGASVDDRTSAVARVGGEVVGGSRIFDDGDGIYVIRVPAGYGVSAGAVGTDSISAFNAADTLQQLPQVLVASPNVISASDGEDWRLPHDNDAAIGHWTLPPDSSTSDKNWAFERVAAPFAWGCTTGDPNVGVAVLDEHFFKVKDLTDNLSVPPTLWDSVPGDRHGTAVASIIAARGDNGVGMAGMMWRADLRLYARNIGPHNDLLRDVNAVSAAMRGRARVINISGNFIPEPEPNATALDSAGKRKVNGRASATMTRVIRRIQQQTGVPPLFVVSAGNLHWNQGQPVDARWNMYPMLHDSLPGQVVVVAASTTADGLLYNSKSGPLVDLAAPGVNVLSLDESGDIAQQGFVATSAATPLVAGAAGLLFSFDPSLTPAQVKQYLIDGARRGKRHTGGMDDYPILNAYEALKASAERPGAPLCGNRVWVTDDGRVTAQRGSGTDVLGTVQGNGDYVYVPHGGRRVIFSTNAASAPDGVAAFDWAPSTGWAPIPGDPWDLPESCGIIYCRWTAFQYSHDNDLFVDLAFNWGGNGIAVSVVDTTGARQRAHVWQIGVVPYAFDATRIRPPSYAHVDWIITPHDDGTADTVLTNPQQPSYSDTVWQSLLTRYDNPMLWAAYSPLGDSVYVAVTPLTSVLHLGATLAPCPGTAYFNGVPVERCTASWYATELGDAAFYTLPAAASPEAVASPTLNARPTTQLGRSGRPVLWMGLAHNGREAIIADAVFTGDSSGYGPTFGACELRWVDLRTGSTQYGPIRSAHSCDWAYGSAYIGTTAPDKAPLTPGLLFSRASGPASPRGVLGQPSAAPASQPLPAPFLGGRGAIPGLGSRVVMEEHAAGRRPRRPKYLPGARVPARPAPPRFEDWLRDVRAKYKKSH